MHSFTQLPIIINAGLQLLLYLLGLLPDIWIPEHHHRNLISLILKLEQREQRRNSLLIILEHVLKQNHNEIQNILVWRYW